MIKQIVVVVLPDANPPNALLQSRMLEYMSNRTEDYHCLPSPTVASTSTAMAASSAVAAAAACSSSSTSSVAARPSPAIASLAMAVSILVVGLPGWGCAALEFLLQTLVCLSHLCIAQVHFPVEVIGQASIVVKSAQICAAHVAHLQLLVARWARCVRQRLELSLPIILGGFGLTKLEELGNCLVDGALVAQHGDFFQANLNGPREIGDLFQQGIGLADFVWRLFQPALGRVDSAIALFHVFLHVSHVVPLEAPSPFLVRVRRLVLILERLRVRLGARAKVLFCVRKEIVWTGANEVRTADFDFGHAELWRALSWGREILLAHELLCDKMSVVSGQWSVVNAIGGRRHFLPSSFLCSAAMVTLELERKSLKLRLVLKFGGAFKVLM
jgi:hypothetical protein